jgi:hypothetical protein
MSQYRCASEVSLLGSLEAFCLLVVDYTFHTEYQQSDLVKKDMESP